MPDALEQSLKRLAAAVDLLERAAERRMRHDEARANAEEEYALMQDDRSRLAVELDAALDRSRALEAANARGGRAAGARGADDRRGSSSGWTRRRTSARRRHGEGLAHGAGFGDDRQPQVPPRLQRGRGGAARVSSPA